MKKISRFEQFIGSSCNGLFCRRRFHAHPVIGGRQAADPCGPPRCLDAAVPYPSDLKVPDDHVRIVLPVHYDPMISKLSVWAPSRKSAI